MKKNATVYVRPEIREMDGYHSGDFKNLTFFNSDRKINLNRNYTVSENNTESTKKIVKVGAHLKGFGTEIETVGRPICLGTTVYTNLLDLIFSKAGFDDDFFKIESDCTVNGECITQVFSKSWLRNNYKLFKGMYELFDSFGITTDSEKCGMHVNLDTANLGSDYDTQIENARKLGYVINKHYDFFTYAFYRNRAALGYCGRMPSDKNYWKTNPIESFYNDHHVSYNLGHIRHGRVEIRLVGGQKNYPCFRNTMETVFHLIDRICKLSWNDLDDLTKIFKGCNKHVWDRISTNCYQAGYITESDLNAIRPTVKDERFL